MKTIFGNILLVFFLSLSLSGSTERISLNVNDEIITSPLENIVYPSQRTKTDNVIDALFSERFADSLKVIKNKERQISDTTALKVCKESAKSENASKQAKTTMFDLLVKWIVLLLEVNS